MVYAAEKLSLSMAMGKCHDLLRVHDLVVLFVADKHIYSLKTDQFTNLLNYKNNQSDYYGLTESKVHPSDLHEYYKAASGIGVSFRILDKEKQAYDFYLHSLPVQMTGEHHSVGFFFMGKLKEYINFSLSNELVSHNENSLNLRGLDLGKDSSSIVERRHQFYFPAESSTKKRSALACL